MPKKVQYYMHHGGSRRITSSGLLNYIKKLKIILKDRYLIGRVFDATRCVYLKFLDKHTGFAIWSHSRVPLQKDGE